MLFIAFYLIVVGLQIHRFAPGRAQMTPNPILFLLISSPKSFTLQAKNCQSLLRLSPLRNAPVDSKSSILFALIKINIRHDVKKAN